MLQGRIKQQLNYWSQEKLRPHKTVHKTIKKEDKQLFQSSSILLFQLTQLLNQNNPITSDGTYTALYGVIKRWNRSMLQNPIQSNRRVQYFRNQYIYQTMKNILFQPKKLAKIHIQNLYKWYKNNSEEKSCSFNVQLTQVLSHMKKKKLKIDEDCQIRDTYKSTLPFEIHLYQRKTFEPILNQRNQRATISQSETAFHHQFNKNKCMQKFRSQNKSYTIHNKRDLYDYTKNKYFIHKNLQSQLIRQKQLEQVKATMLNWNSAKTKSKQHLIKNFHKSYFKTATLFFPKKQRSHQLSESFLKTQNSLIKIKKSCLNSSLGFKNFNSNQLLNEIKTFKIQSKLGTKNQMQKNKQDKNQQSFYQVQKQNLPQVAKNINGIGLIINPFDIKLSKGKKNK